MTNRDKVRAFRDSWVAETGEPMSLAVAAVLMDREADAEYERRAGGAYEPADDADYVIASGSVIIAEVTHSELEHNGGPW